MSYEYHCEYKSCTKPATFTIQYNDPWDFSNCCEEHLKEELLDCIKGYDLPKTIQVTKFEETK